MAGRTAGRTEGGLYNSRRTGNRGGNPSIFAKGSDGTLSCRTMGKRSSWFNAGSLFVSKTFDRVQFDAFRAGSTPNIRPTPTETVSPVITAHSGTAPAGLE